MSRTKIAVVSYLNSIPFNYGIEHSGLIDAQMLSLSPVECSKELSSGGVDIALVPIAAIPNLGVEVDIVTSYCIGASGAVRTVVLLSDEPIDKIQRIWLDGESQTSVRLLAHLCDHHFKISPKWHILSDMSRLQHPKDGDAFLLIGDKVFSHEGEFEYSYDLCKAWGELTSLPFVFAAWCARKGVDQDVICDLEAALEWGVEHTYEALVTLRGDIDVEQGYQYLTENIDPLLDGGKREAMAQFWSSESVITLSSTDE